METIPSLWETTIDFISKHPEHVVKGNDSIMPWITDSNFLTYNGCHFWSNFEVSDKWNIQRKRIGNMLTRNAARLDPWNF